MALLYYDITLSGITRVSSTNVPVSYIRMENPTGNADVNFGGSAVSSTVKGGTVKAGEANAVVLGPFPHGLMDLTDLYFKGSDNNVVHITAVSS